MFSRLGTWCHDRRRLVLGALDRGAARRQRHRRRRRRRLPAGLLARRASSRPRASRSSSPSSTTAAARRSPARSSSRPSRASTTPRSAPRWRRCSPRSPSIDDVTAVQSPYAPGGEFQISDRGDAAGRIAYATVNLPEDIDFTRAADDRRRDPRRCIPDDRRAAGRARRLPLRRVRAAVGRAVRPRLRHHHPHRRLRLGAGDGPAGRRRAVRHRAGRRVRHPGQPPHRGPRLRAVRRPDDRPRRRHRLRAADRHPLPRAAPRGARRPRVDRHRHGHRRPLGACSPAPPS